MIERLKPHLWAWRHPRPAGAEGRCVGRTDLPLDARRAKRLARIVQRTARREGLPHVVWTSPLERCAAVGRWLRRWGWRHRVDASLLEMDFGAWEGRVWNDIPKDEIDAWCADFPHHAPGGGGESVSMLLTRAAAWQPVERPVLVIGHAGWMIARRFGPRSAGLRADEWPAPPRHGERWPL